MSLIDRLIAQARESGDMEKSYCDRLIDNDPYAVRDMGGQVSRMRSAASVVSKAVGGYIDAAQENGVASDLKHHTNSESPIESALAFALTVFSNVRVEPKRCFDIREAISTAESAIEDVNLFQQVWLVKNRMDFLVTLRADSEIKLLCVEADGAAYHHNTIEQAISDNRRSAELTIHGVHVVRFTGREIHYEIESCVETIRQILTAWGATKLG